MRRLCRPRRPYRCATTDSGFSAMAGCGGPPRRRRSPHTAAQARLSGPATAEARRHSVARLPAAGGTPARLASAASKRSSSRATRPSQGMYVPALRAPANMTIQAHSHKDDRVRHGAEGHVAFRLWREVRREGAQGASARESPTRSRPTLPHFARTKERSHHPRSSATDRRRPRTVNPADDPARK